MHLRWSCIYLKSKLVIILNSEAARTEKIFKTVEEYCRNTKEF